MFILVVDDFFESEHYFVKGFEGLLMDVSEALYFFIEYFFLEGSIGLAGFASIAADKAHVLWNL